MRVICTEIYMFQNDHQAIRPVPTGKNYPAGVRAAPASPPGSKINPPMHPPAPMDKSEVKRARPPGPLKTGRIGPLLPGLFP